MTKWQRPLQRKDSGLVLSMGTFLGEWKERDGDGYENGNNIFSIIKRDGGYSGNLFPNASVFPPVRIGAGVLQDVPQEVAAGD